MAYKQVIKWLKLTLFSLLCTAGLLFIATIKPAEAGLFCGGVGTGGLRRQNTIPVTQFGYANATRDVGHRKYTIMELMGNSGDYAIPYGETKGDWLVRQENNSISSVVGELSAEQKERLEAQGKDGFCFVAGIGPYFQQMSDDVVRFFSGLISSVITATFDSHLVCDVGERSFGCIDLLGIAGGTEESPGGLIGTMSKTLFAPLMGISTLLLVCYLAYQGFIKRQYRVALGGIVWFIFVIALGLFTMAKPWAVARAPYHVTQFISRCTLNILGGGSCLEEGESYLSPAIDHSCTSFTTGDATASQHTQLTLSSVSCKITKGFTVDRWTQQQFGYAYNDLFTKNAPPGHQVYPADKLQGNPEDYCVNLYTEHSPNELTRRAFRNEQNTFDEKFQVCNIAATYMANNTIGNFGNQAKMEHVIATAAKDQRMWSAFKGDGRDWFGFGTIIGILATTITFVPYSILTLAFSFIAMFLVIFAPVFLTLALEPGRGRRIFKGWLEALLETLMKFFTHSLLVIVMIGVFSAVYQSLSSMMIMIMSIVLATTFALYRKELVNMTSKVNLGGLRLTNHAEQAMNKVANKAESMTTAVVGGTIGGAMAGDAFGGMKEAVGVELRKGGGFVANAARAHKQVSTAKKREVEKAQTEARAEEKQKELVEALKQTSSNIQGTIEQVSSEQAKAFATEFVDAVLNDVSNDKVKQALRQSVLKLKTGELTTKDVYSQTTIGKDLDKHFAQSASSVEGKKSYLNSMASKFQQDIDSILHTMKNEGKTSEQIEQVQRNMQQALDNHMKQASEGIVVRQYNGTEQLISVDLDKVYQAQQDLQNELNRLTAKQDEPKPTGEL